MFSKKLKLPLLASMFLGLTFFVSCDEDNPYLPEKITKNLVEILDANPNLTDFVSIADRLGLKEALKERADRTVFVPTNEAISDYLNGGSIDDLTDEQLEDLLSYHFIDDKNVRTSAEYATMSKEAGPNGEKVSIKMDKVEGKYVFNGDSDATADVGSTSGIIHIVDKVLEPIDAAELINSSKFSVLNAAFKIVKENGTTDFIDVLSQEGPFTVFAPTNAAFEKLLKAEGLDASLDALADVPVADLEAILKYHVVKANINVQSGQLEQGQDIEMLDGNKITIKVKDNVKSITTPGNLVKKEGSEELERALIGISKANIQGTNGVIHAVDQVLLPVAE